MALSKEQILKANDLKIIELDVPEWGGVVRIQTMTGTARQQFQEALNVPKGKMPKHMMEALLVATLIDDNGGPLFSVDDIAELAKKSSIAIQRVWEAAADLNGLTDKSVKALEKN